MNEVYRKVIPLQINMLEEILEEIKLVSLKNKFAGFACLLGAGFGKPLI